MQARVKGPASVLWPGYGAAFPAIQRGIADSVAAVRHEIHRSQPQPYGQPHGQGQGQGQGQRACQVFGYDFLVDDGGRPWLLEANAAPQLGHPQAMPSLRRSLALPMINGIAAVLALPRRQRTRGYGQWGFVPLPA